MILLDSPVFNSGRLKLRILEHTEKWRFSVKVELAANPDNLLSKLDNVVTTDSVILDSCLSWINLSKKFVKNLSARQKLLI